MSPLLFAIYLHSLFIYFLQDKYNGLFRNILNLFFGPKLLDVVDNYIYLSVKLNFNGRFVKEKQFRYSNGCRAMFSLLGKARTLPLPIDIQLQLFHKLVTPVVMYGAEAWHLPLARLTRVHTAGAWPYRVLQSVILSSHVFVARCTI